MYFGNDAIKNDDNYIVNEEGKLVNIKNMIDKFKKNKEENDKHKEKVKIFKAKEKEFKNLPAEEVKKVRDGYKKAIDEFVKLGKSELDKLMKEPKFRAHIRKDIDRAFKDETLDPVENKKLYNNDKMPEVTFYHSHGYFVVMDEPQMVRVACSRICEELAKRLAKITGYYIQSGDGDEGCIYPEELATELFYYINLYGKE